MRNNIRESWTLLFHWTYRSANWFVVLTMTVPSLAFMMVYVDPKRPTSKLLRRCLSEAEMKKNNKFEIKQTVGKFKHLIFIARSHHQKLCCELLKTFFISWLNLNWNIGSININKVNQSITMEIKLLSHHRSIISAQHPLTQSLFECPWRAKSYR